MGVDHANRDAARWIGAVLQRKWLIDSRIAEGGFATVFHATHIGDSSNKNNNTRRRVAAIKIMHSDMARNADLRARFLRESYAANQVGHPGVVRIIEHDIAEDGSPYIVMDLLEGGELLKDRWERSGGRIPLTDVALICDQVLAVLGAAHDRGIVHRDIKPDNIYILADGFVKVLDFGLAHIKQALVEYEPTRTGLLVGTPEFMSPEQALGQPGQIDAQTDLYAVGAMMFTLLSGEIVHAGHDLLTNLVVATGTRQARSLADVPLSPGLPREIISLVDTALALEKHRRWGSARMMRDALREAVPEVEYSNRGEDVVFTAPLPRLPPDDDDVEKQHGEQLASAAPSSMEQPASTTEPPPRPPASSTTEPPVATPPPPAQRMVTLLSEGAKPPPPAPAKIFTATLRSKGGVEELEPKTTEPISPTMHSPSGVGSSVGAPWSSKEIEIPISSAVPESPTIVKPPGAAPRAHESNVVSAADEEVSIEVSSAPAPRTTAVDNFAETVRWDSDPRNVGGGKDDLVGQQETARLQPHQLPPRDLGVSRNLGAASPRNEGGAAARRDHQGMKATPPAPEPEQSTTMPLTPLPGPLPSDPNQFRENNTPARPMFAPARPIPRSAVPTTNTRGRQKNPYATLTFVAVALLALTISLWIGGCLLLRL